MEIQKISLKKFLFPADVWQIIMSYCKCHERFFKDDIPYYITKYSKYYERYDLYRLIKHKNTINFAKYEGRYKESHSINHFTINAYLADYKVKTIYDENLRMCKINTKADNSYYGSRGIQKITIYAGQTTDFNKALKKYTQLMDTKSEITSEIDKYKNILNNLLNRNFQGEKVSMVKCKEFINIYNQMHKEITGKPYKTVTSIIKEFNYI